MTPQEYYEAELAIRPLFYDGRPRPQWHELPDTVKKHWETGLRMAKELGIVKE